MRLRTASVFAVTGLALASQVTQAHEREWREVHAPRYVEAYRDGGRFERQARVVRVEPVIEVLRGWGGGQECRWGVRQQEQAGAVVVRRGPDPGAALVGGLIGAAIGHEAFERGDRGLGTVAGAVIGGAIGGELGARREPEVYLAPRRYPEAHCEARPVEHWRRQVVGYRVTYWRDGRLFSTQLPYDPGPRLPGDFAFRPRG
jgi:uncharacterized protein YcfJ